MYLDYLKEKLEDIEKILDRKEWISSYQIFLQSINTSSGKSFEEDVIQIANTVRMGTSIKILTKNKRMLEESYSISEISKINDLRAPKSTLPFQYISKFIDLKVPNSSSISGDFANTVDMKASPYLDTLDLALNSATNYDIPFSHSVDVSLENRLIKNMNSIMLTENSLKVDYKVSTKFEIFDFTYALSRNSAGRSLKLDVSNPIDELVGGINSIIKSKPLKIPESPAILLHPEVIGTLISYYYSNFVTQFSHMADLSFIQWDENFVLYDDPSRSGGYYSTLFDDEGTLARSKQLISDGHPSNTLSSFSTSNWVEGGNGYKVNWFQPNVRSYQFNIRPAISNLVLTGGAGKGQYFSERPGSLIKIRKGFGYPISRLGDFIFHVHEAELYKDGELQGPLVNISISGNLNEILNRGQLSSDELVVIDPTIPGSIYSGWLIVPPSILSLRS